MIYSSLHSLLSTVLIFSFFFTPFNYSILNKAPDSIPDYILLEFETVPNVLLADISSQNGLGLNGVTGELKLSNPFYKFFMPIKLTSNGAAVVIPVEGSSSFWNSLGLIFPGSDLQYNLRFTDTAQWVRVESNLKDKKGIAVNLVFILLELIPDVASKNPGEIIQAIGDFAEAEQVLEAVIDLQEVEELFNNPLHWRTPGRVISIASGLEEFAQTSGGRDYILRILSRMKIAASNDELNRIFSFIKILSRLKYFTDVCVYVGISIWSGNFNNSYLIRPLTLNTNNLPPFNPVPLTPMGDGISLTPEFQWGIVRNASSYNLQVDNSHDFTSPEINEILTVNSFVPGSQLVPDTTYYWRVIARNQAGEAISNIITFKVGLIAYPPVPKESDDDGSRFLSDVSLPDGTYVTPSQSLTKTWRVRNTGSSTWGSGYRLVFIGGDRMNAPNEVSVPAAAPGQEVDLSVPLTAPTRNGDYTGRFRMRNPQGTFFGDTLWVSVTVSSSNLSGGHITLFDITPPSPSASRLLHIVGRARYFPEFRSMRLVLGSEVQEMTNFRQVGDQLEMSYDWNTASLPRGIHAVVFEVAKHGDNSWSSAERQVRSYTLTGAPVSNNRPPDRPLLKSPYDWFLRDLSGSSASVELCVHPATDPDGNPVQYRFEARDQGGGVAADSGWVSGPCWTHTYSPQTYAWRVKTGDGSAESDWSQETWHFSVAGGGVYIGSHQFFNLHNNDTHFCVFVTYDGIQGPDVRAFINLATDGSESGEWRQLDHYGPNTTPDCTQPDYHGFWIRAPFYPTGTHKIKVSAVKPDSGENATKEFYYYIPYIRPPEPDPIAPSTRLNNGTWWNTRAIHFEWKPALRAESYQLRASTNSNPWADPAPILEVLNIDGLTTHYDHTFQQDYAGLYWSVRAVNSEGSADSGPDVWFGIDTVNPTCHIQPPAAVTYENVFQVNWGGADNSSGVVQYDVQYRDSNRIEWQDWLLKTPADHPFELFNGQPGHGYSFRCRATDRAGNTSGYSTASSSIKIDPAARPPALWWNSAYAYKRTLLVQNNMGGIPLPDEYPVRLHFDSGTNPTAAEMYNASQSAVKCNDLRIVQNDTTELSRYITNCTSSAIDFWFRAQEAIPAGGADGTHYQLYYGNASASAPANDPGQIFYPAREAGTTYLYYFQEGSGSSTADYSGNNRACSINPTVQWSQGRWGSGLRITHANAGDSRSLNCGSAIPLSAFTVEFWYKPDSDDGGRIAGELAGGGNGGGGSNWMIQNVSGHIRLDTWECPTCGSQEVSSNFSLNDLPYRENWNHIAVTFNGGNEVKFYINGALDSTKYLQDSGINMFTPPLEIGSAEGIGQIKANIGAFRISSGVKTSFPYGVFAEIRSDPSTQVGQVQTPPAAGFSDLAVLDMDAFPNPDGGLLVRAVVQNQGNLDTLNGFFTDLYMNHLPDGSGDYSGSLQFWVNDPIQPGEIITLTTVLDPAISLAIEDPSAASPLAPAAETTGTLYAQADSTGAINEDDNQDNIYSQGLEICTATADEFEGLDPDGNLLINPGFEDGVHGQQGNPTGWRRDAWNIDTAQLTWDNTVSHTGTKSIKITSATPNDARWLQTVSLLPHTSYRLSGWFRTQNVAHSPLLGDAGANLSLYGTWYRSNGLFGTHDWVYDSFEFNTDNTGTVPTGEVAARLGYWSGETTGTVWFDDLRLEQVNPLPAGDDITSGASLMNLGSLALHNFHKVSDQDWIKFYAVSGKRYLIKTQELGATADTYLFLYDTDSTTLLNANDDANGTLASEIVWTAPANGVYYVLVKHWNPNMGGCGTSYRINLDLDQSRLFLPLIKR